MRPQKTFKARQSGCDTNDRAIVTTPMTHYRGSSEASHQELIDRARALAAFADRPDHQRLAAAHVAAGEDLGTLVW